MKIGNKPKEVPSGASLTLSVQYNVADIKAALLDVDKRQPDGGIGITLQELVKMLHDTATDSHMPDAPRWYIAEWMVRRAVKEGFIFKANAYIGEVSTDEDLYIILVGSVRKKMRGRPKKNNK